MQKSLFYLIFIIMLCRCFLQSIHVCALSFHHDGGGISGVSSLPRGRPRRFHTSEDAGPRRSSSSDTAASALDPSTRRPQSNSHTRTTTARRRSARVIIVSSIIGVALTTYEFVAIRRNNSNQQRTICLCGVPSLHRNHKTTNDSFLLPAQ